MKGTCADPWTVGIFNLDFLTVLTAYMFLSFGPVQAGAFAVGQGFLIDIYSGGLHGLFAFIYLSVFCAIYVGSLFFNLQTPKGQVIITGLAMVLKGLLFLVVLSVFSSTLIITGTFLTASAVSIAGTGLITPPFFALFNRLRRVPEREADEPFIEEV